MQAISFTDFESWADRQSPLIRENAFFDEAEHFEDESAQFHQGDLQVDTLMVAPVTVIEGNASIREIDHDFDVGLLVVTGDLTCEHIGRMGINIVVGGNLYATSLCLNTLNDFSLVVGGNITCDVFAEHGCYVEVHGKIQCPKVLSLMNKVVAHGGVDGELISHLRGKDVAQVVVKEVLSADGYFDEAKFEARVRNGQSPFKAS